MKKIFVVAAWMALVFLPVYLFAQTVPCTYTLELIDDAADGWNGASLTVTINAIETAYTLNDGPGGGRRVIEIPLLDGDSVSLRFAPGQFDDEIRYVLYDQVGTILFADGPRPQVGIAFAFRVGCPSCPLPSVNTINIFDTRAFTARVSWTPSDLEGRYELEYGPRGFTPGSGRTVSTMTNQAQLTGLIEYFPHDIYLRVFCANGDTSRLAGPFPFRTRWAKDVGIIDILNPVTGCDLTSSEAIQMHIQNFGGEPQSLVSFRYSVNGLPISIDDPRDGFYTDVLGKDSIDLLEFDRQFDFSQPGVYQVAGWTLLAGDTIPTNDTTYATVVSVPTIVEFPYHETFEAWQGGWTVSDSSENASWSYGRPAGDAIFGAESGTKAWVTNLTGSYNNNEQSYLISPCLDFSGLENDPQLSFDLWVDTESCCDRLWVETSTDGGATWSKVGSAFDGVGWYNDPNENVWRGDGGFEGWVTAANTLVGTAGAGEVRIRLVFQSDFSANREGIGFDNIAIKVTSENDLALLGLSNGTEPACGLLADTLVARIGNLGAESVDAYTIAFQVNDGPVTQIDTSNVELEAGATVDFALPGLISFPEPGLYNIRAWLVDPDGFALNDTALLRVATGLPLPFYEDFETGLVPNEWQVDDNAQVSNNDTSLTNLLSGNLFALDTIFEAVTPVLGRVGAQDSLSFSYRFIDFILGEQTPATLTADDLFEVQVSTDCGANYETIFSLAGDEHQPTAEMTGVKVSLEAYADIFIQVRFLASWGAGDYLIQLDDVGIINCPSTLDLDVLVRDELFPEIEDGRVDLNIGAGRPPYAIEWSTGETGFSLENLAAGNYTVTVTDKFGCTDSESFSVGLVNSVRRIEILEALSLFPNPAKDRLTLEMAFAEAVDVQVEVLNTLGVPLNIQRFDNVREQRMQLPITGLPAGMYWVRLQVEGQSVTRRWIKVVE